MVLLFILEIFINFITVSLLVITNYFVLALFVSIAFPRGILWSQVFLTTDLSTAVLTKGGVFNNDFNLILALSSLLN